MVLPTPRVSRIRRRHRVDLIATLLGVNSALLFLIYAAAVARLAVLITEDKIAERPRNALIRRWSRAGDESYRVYLLLCQWCISVWIAAVAAPVWYFLGDNPWFLIPAAGLAFSYLAGKLSQFGG